MFGLSSSLRVTDAATAEEDGGWYRIWHCPFAMRGATHDYLRRSV